jgi:glycosyltransferase involved in cell wall biosynthesis
MLHRDDAVGRHTLRLRDLFVARGISSRIYVETIDAETAAESEPFTAYDDRRRPDDVLLYQFATASALAPWLAGRGETLVVNYHNVTPPEHYAPWDNGLARHQVEARAQLSALGPRATLGVAVSRFNEEELRAAGYASTTVVPPAAMLPAPGRPCERAPAGPPGARWISVGRLAPNKALQHAVMALLVARAHHDPAATLQVVGRPVVPSYTRALHRFVDEMGLHGAVSFLGRLSDAALADAMAEAHVLVLTSAHEGFGVPVIEAMAHGLPVVANASGALPDVVGAGGVLVDAADPWALAGAVDGVLTDAARRATLAAAALTQLAALDLNSAGSRLVDLVAVLGETRTR